MNGTVQPPPTLWRLAQDAMNAAEDTASTLAIEALGDHQPDEASKTARREYYRLRDELLRACTRVDDGRDWRTT